MSQRIAVILSDERKAQGLSQMALADRAGFTQSQLSKHLRGERVLTVDGLDALCVALGLDIVDVVRDAADNETADAIEIDFLSFTDIRGRNVYLLKDVVATGVIENYLLSQLRTHEPASLPATMTASARIRTSKPATRPDSAVRPRYSVLDVDPVAKALGRPMRHWRDALRAFKAEVDARGGFVTTSAMWVSGSPTRASSAGTDHASLPRNATRTVMARRIRPVVSRGVAAAVRPDRARSAGARRAPTWAAPPAA